MSTWIWTLELKFSVDGKNSRPATYNASWSTDRQSPCGEEWLTANSPQCFCGNVHSHSVRQVLCAVRGSLVPSEGVFSQSREEEKLSSSWMCALERRARVERNCSLELSAPHPSEGISIKPDANGKCRNSMQLTCTCFMAHFNYNERVV